RVEGRIRPARQIPGICFDNLLPMAGHREFNRALADRRETVPIAGTKPSVVVAHDVGDPSSHSLTPSEYPSGRSRSPGAEQPGSGTFDLNQSRLATQLSEN